MEFFIIIAFGIIASLAYVIIRFFLKPLFFPNFFPKKEVFNILENLEAKYVSHIKISKKEISENKKLYDFKSDNVLNDFFFNTSYYKIIAFDELKRKKIILIIRWVKSYSLLARSKITYNIVSY